MVAISEKDFYELVNYVKKNYGINLAHKRSLVLGRLQHFLAQNGFRDFSQYFQTILSDSTGNAGAVLINKLTTNYTYFAREREHFVFFQNKVLPQLVLTEARKKDLRIWSAGCSSGEEAYTLAMIIDNYFGSDKREWDTKVLATDISTKMLEKAVRGIYTSEQIDSLPQNWRWGYFKRINGEKNIVVDKIRNEIIFRRFNLMTSVFPFKKKFHVIFCRNVMIYFDQETKRELINKFYEYTEDGGYLFIGQAESLNRNESKYKYILPAIYRKE